MAGLPLADAPPPDQAPRRMTARPSAWMTGRLSEASMEVAVLLVAYVAVEFKMPTRRSANGAQAGGCVPIGNNVNVAGAVGAR